MSTSIGGGYCDCGDPEAWKENVHCSIHMPASDAASVDPLANVPLDIQNRARQVFSAVLKYSYELLTLDTFMKLPGDLQYKSGENMDLMDDLLEVEDMYATVLFNDEVHTFDEVIMTLTKALDDCDRTKAINYVSLIDKEGRALVKCSQFQACNEVKRIVERITGRRGNIISYLFLNAPHIYVLSRYQGSEGHGDPQSRGGSPGLRYQARHLAGLHPLSLRGLPRPLQPHPDRAGGGHQRKEAAKSSGGNSQARH